MKYKHAIGVLTNYCLIDETRGILAFEDLKSKVSSVCEQNDVDFCILFGSYSKGKATEKSDVDLLLKTNAKGIAFYGLVEDLRQSLRKKVDVLRVEDLDGNTALMSEIFRDGVKIYG
ncbi:MAG: nucleotidyltransferase domain-containing protein [Spirochaetales bacterium]|nr:nucleotidyltransferase domain-containing protein [Spirochaetales bacterium]